MHQLCNNGNLIECFVDVIFDLNLKCSISNQVPLLKIYFILVYYHVHNELNQISQL